MSGAVRREPVGSAKPYRELPEEYAARFVVCEVLGLEVDRHEDGRQNSQVDAIIRDVDDFPLEIVTDRNKRAKQQWAEFGRRGHYIVLESGRTDWYVTVKSGANVRDLHTSVPKAIANDSPIHELRGVVLADSVPTPVGSPPRAFFMVEPVGQLASGQLDPWLRALFEGAPDLARKLGAVNASQRHLFVWATVDTDYSVIDFLEDDLTPLPEGAASVPEPITHLWVASVFAEEWLLRWSRDRGWWRVAMPGKAADM